MTIHKDFKGIHKKMRVDYDVISSFLDSTKDTAGMFETALTNVSADLWIRFAALTGRNRFTRALGDLAQHRGFNLTDDRVSTVPHIDIVMTGSVSAEYFADQVKAGRFWKDSFSASHGEYSHALQWLAIADAQHNNIIELSQSAADVYKSLFDPKNRHSFYSRKKKQQDEGWLWSWLCDAFQTGSAELSQDECPQTSFRSPQRVMDYLFGNPANPGGHFLRFYLLRRYIKRGYLEHQLEWLQRLGGSAQRGTAFIEYIGEEQPFKVTSGEGALGASATAAYGTKTAAIWKPEKDRGHGNATGTAFERVNQGPPYYAVTGSKTHPFNVTFHGHQGIILIDPNIPNDVI